MIASCFIMLTEENTMTIYKKQHKQEKTSLFSWLFTE
jgi:hypothetical protein